MNEQRKHKRLVVVLSLAVILLLVTVAALGLTVFRLSRVNLFSKNIELSNTWMFEQEETGGTAERKEYPSFPAADINEEYAEMYDTLFDYQADLYQKQEAVNDTLKSMQEAFSGRILDVPHLNQQEASLPNGCEAVSAAMLLQYHGISMSPETFVTEHLKCESVKIRWGCRYGPDPSKAYAGDPHSEKGGWGCFAPVIINALNDCLPQDLRAADLTGAALDELASLYVASDVPVAIWVTQDMTPIEKAYQWQSYDKTETFLYPVNSHCVVLCGSDEEYFYVSDPLSAESVVRYERAAVEKSYRSMGMQAVAVVKTEVNGQ